jgi:hypothetical protein
VKSPSTGEVSAADEPERDFRARIQHRVRETRDQAVDALRKKYGPKQAALDERLRKAKLSVEKENQQATGAKLQAAISVGATLMGALLGRKAVSASTLGRATTAARGAGRAMKEAEDISRAENSVAAIEAQRTALDEALAAETAALDAAGPTATETLEKLVLKPKKGNITVKIVALVWQ